MTVQEIEKLLISKVTKLSDAEIMQLVNFADFLATKHEDDELIADCSKISAFSLQKAFAKEDANI